MTDGWSEARNDGSGDLRMFCEAGKTRGERKRTVKNRKVTLLQCQS